MNEVAASSVPPLISGAVNVLSVSVCTSDVPTTAPASPTSLLTSAVEAFTSVAPAAKRCVCADPSWECKEVLPPPVRVFKLVSVTLAVIPSSA